MGGVRRIFSDRNDLLLAVLAIPLYVAAVGRYGFKILFALLISVIIGTVVEIAAFKIRKKEIDLLGYPAWILFPLVLPPVFPLWMTGVAFFFGVVIGVAFFGGHGRTLVSPVAIAWAFAVLSFPFAFDTAWSLPFSTPFFGFKHYIAAVLTVDHPLVYFDHRIPKSITDILIGNFPQPPDNAIPYVVLGCGVLLLLLRVIDFRMCLSFVGTVALLAVSGKFLFPLVFQHGFELFIGDLFFAAFFIIADRRISPRTHTGSWLTGILTGMIAFITRSFSSYPDSTFFAVLFGNVFSAIIDEGVLKYTYKGIHQ